MPTVRFRNVADRNMLESVRDDFITQGYVIKSEGETGVLMIRHAWGPAARSGSCEPCPVTNPPGGLAYPPLLPRGTVLRSVSLLWLRSVGRCTPQTKRTPNIALIVQD